MRQVYGNQLSQEAQQEALNRFLHRMTKESIERWPVFADWMIRRGGYRLPPISDQEWLAQTLFWVTDSGRLAKRRHCETQRGLMAPH